ncbi:MAG TPA: glycosyltransferase [Propionibacteriaceae bacterium]|nr:glycosyltransferase [Propionibacteriaceae bacterium]
MRPAGTVTVTVVISTLDRPHQLSRCLAALAAGSRRPEAVVVVDQGVSPSAEAVQSARAAGLVVSHLSQPRLGLSASQNEGVSAAKTSVVAIVDDDCVPDRQWVEIVWRSFVAADGPLLLTGRVLPLPVQGDRVAPLSVRDSEQPMTWTRPPMPWRIGTGGNFAVDRERYLAVGGNDTRLGTGSPGRGGNDLDLFYRLVRAGATARYEPDLVVQHERATAAEFAQRRGSYGYGVGAMLGVWLRRGDLRAVLVFAAWLRLRARLGCSRRSNGGIRHELRVLKGTLQGLLRGAQLPPLPPRDRG